MPTQSSRGSGQRISLRRLSATRGFAVCALLLTMLVWGSAFAVTKSAEAQIPPLLFALLRFLVASACLLIFTQMRGGIRLLPTPLPVGKLALMGLTGVTLYYIGFNLSLSFTSASEGALIQGSIPVITAMLAIIFLRERFSRVRALGIAVSMLGVALIVLTNTASTGAHRLVGDLLMLGAVFAWSAYTIVGKRVAGLSAIAVTTYSTLLGTLFLVPAAAYDLAIRPPRAIAWGSWIAVLYLGIGASALMVALWNFALRSLDASQAANFVNLVPVVGVSTAALFLGEALTVRQLIGGALVLFGVWLSSRTR